MKAFIIGSLATAMLLGASTSGFAQTTALVAMRAQNSSGQIGTATLKQAGSDVVVTVSVADRGAAQPAHIHQGTCAKLNPAPKYPLANVVNGRSTTTLKNIKLSSLTTGGFAINVHKSLSEIAVYTSCGNIPKS